MLFSCSCGTDCEISFPFFFYHKTLVWACLNVMQVFVCFKQSPGALKVFRPQGERGPDVRRTASLAPKGPGTATDTAGNMGYKYTSAHTLSLTLSLSLSHAHTDTVILKFYIPKPHFVQTLAAEQSTLLNYSSVKPSTPDRGTKNTVFHWI